MRDWTQSDRNEFYRSQPVHAGNDQSVLDRCGWIKRMHESWKPESILDVACRDGYVTRCFLDQGSKVMGIDINQIAIDIATESASKVKGAEEYAYICGDVLDGLAQFKDDSMDLVMSFEFIEHVPIEFVASVFKEMHRISYGKCSISTPRKDGGFGEQNVNDSGHINCYDEERLVEEILQVTGARPSVESDKNFYYVWWKVGEP